jgi:hypothetical protein
MCTDEGPSALREKPLRLKAFQNSMAAGDSVALTGPCHTSLAHLHDILHIAFAWSGEHLSDFHIQGKDYGSHGADASRMSLRDVRWRCGERFRYIDHDFAGWACDIHLEAILPCDPTRLYPI